MNTGPAIARVLSALLLGVPLARVAHATQFPVDGTITVAGTPGALPDGTRFGNSTYDATTGELSAGRFTFPQATAQFPSDFGTVTVTYTVTQTNTSTGQVDTDGVAALTRAVLKLTVDSARVGVIPIGIGTCVFTPIDVDLAGTGDANGLDLSDPSFTIPTVDADDCGGYGDAINTGVAGSDNALLMHMAGDFAPPGASDVIFASGFDAPP